MNEAKIRELIRSEVRSILQDLLIEAAERRKRQWVKIDEAVELTGLSKWTIEQRRKTGRYICGTHYRVVNIGDVESEQGRRYEYNWELLSDPLSPSQVFHA